MNVDNEFVENGEINEKIKISYKFLNDWSINVIKPSNYKDNYFENSIAVGCNHLTHNVWNGKFFLLKEDEETSKLSIFYSENMDVTISKMKWLTFDKIICGTDDGNLRYLDIVRNIDERNDDMLEPIGVTDGPITDLDLNINRKVLSVSSLDGTVRIIDINQLSSKTMINSFEIYSISNKEREMHACKFQPIDFDNENENEANKSDLLAIGCDDSQILFYDLRNNNDSYVLNKFVNDNHPDRHKVQIRSNSGVHSLSWNKSNNNLIASGDGIGFINIYDIRNLSQSLSSFRAHHSIITSLDFSDDDSVVSSGTDQFLHIHHLNLNNNNNINNDNDNYENKYSFNHNDSVTDSSYYKKNSILLSSSMDGLLYFHDLNN
eukprot:TRINITY_DN929_c4_g1_i1.p1 TRINITY_DN929_c4_g1~~TRINITY_DN929_c4_g1_i1.p1  ORF type:complete len:377 (+),score=71.71 TRINITY_DN929_c4_g1_i1:35-1165(+)